jgi:predicted acyl esterase
MELHASVRVMDENDQEVPYQTGRFDRTTGRYFPVCFGALKVSHRKLDPVRSTEYRPFHSHLKEDHQPLKPGEPVEAEVEFWPTTAVVRKGWRIRLDIGPVSGRGIGMKLYDALDQGYQAGATNTVHTGPECPAYVQLPVVPPKR